MRARLSRTVSRVFQQSCVPGVSACARRAGGGDGPRRERPESLATLLTNLRQRTEMNRQMRSRAVQAARATSASPDLVRAAGYYRSGGTKRRPFARS